MKGRVWIPTRALAFEAYSCCPCCGGGQGRHNGHVLPCRTHQPEIWAEIEGRAGP